MQSYTDSFADLAEMSSALLDLVPVVLGSTTASRYERRSESSSSSRTLLIALPTVLGILLMCLLAAIWYRRRRLLSQADADDNEKSITPYTESSPPSGAPTRNSTIRRAATVSCASATGETKECDAASVELGYQSRRDILHLLRWADGNNSNGRLSRVSKQGPPLHPPPSKPLPAVPPSLYGDDTKSPISPISPSSLLSSPLARTPTATKTKVEKKRSWRQSILRRSSSFGTLRRSRREQTPPPELPTYDPTRSYRDIPPLLLSPTYTVHSPDSPWSLSSFLSAVSPRSPIRPLPPLPSVAPRPAAPETPSLSPSRSREGLLDPQSELHMDNTTLASTVASATESERHRIDVVRAIDDAAAVQPPPYAWPGGRHRSVDWDAHGGAGSKFSD
ncbi:unnamed protein product [Peniophora sp. CBMAI 1063]|nr:unnamed protein product [Peniophora sp. CBMAI 1063]